MTPDLPFLAAIYVSKGLYTISTKKQKGLGPEAHRKFETKKTHRRDFWFFTTQQVLHFCVIILGLWFQSFAFFECVLWGVGVLDVCFSVYFLRKHWHPPTCCRQWIFFSNQIFSCQVVGRRPEILVKSYTTFGRPLVSRTAGELWTKNDAQVVNGGMKLPVPKK